RIANGNIGSFVSRRLIDKLQPVIADDVRVTINQGLQFRYIKPENLEYIYSVLESEGLAAAGFGSTADVTSCPGTDTCNLGISNSTGIATVLSEVIEDEYPELLYNKEIAIKISGCMNSCGQHGMASIGFHGSSLKAKGQVLPALQVLIGGGVLGSGEGRISDKILKVPSKRGPDVLRSVLNDYKLEASEGETFLDYSKRRGDRYYYDLLKPLTSLETLLESDEKIAFSEESFANKAWADSIYHAYAATVNAAKALLLQQGVQCNTQAGILKDFDTHFTEKGLYAGSQSFKDTVLQINQVEPSEEFARIYLQQAIDFIAYARTFRENAVLVEK
ncbi:MAG: HEPN domain-containing protein, partial [Chitinophagaceae bacterium]